MNRELKIAIADLQRAFNKTDLASLSIAFSANGTIIDVTDVESIRVILEHRREQPVALFSLDGRPHLKTVSVESTDPADYQSLLAEV